jgi:cell division septation protein DedD
LAFTCPECGGDDVRPSMRRVWEWMLILLGLRPFRCMACYTRFFRFAWGGTHHQPQMEHAVPRNKDWESEFEASNRQSLSVFFLVVILLGIFFTIGYIVGRNHAPVTADAVGARHTETNPVVVALNAPPGRPTPAAVRASAEKAAAEPVQKAKNEPHKTEPAIVEPSKSEAPKSERAAPESSSGGPSGIYLQLTATSKLEAEIMVDALRRKRFGSLAAEIPQKAGTYRVLVGPVREGNVNKLRADLQDAGFPGNGAIKRTF